MSIEIKRIITHRNPDLDAIGVVYLARRKFGRTITFQLVDSPSLDQLKNPHILVGDVGLKEYPELGYRPDLHNFDHHFGVAKECASLLFYKSYPDPLVEDLVTYINEVDIPGNTIPKTGKNSLKLITVGTRVFWHKQNERRIITEGGKVLNWIIINNLNPEDLPLPPPPVVRYLAIGERTIEEIHREIESMEYLRSKQGRKIGYLVSSCPVKSVIKEEMFISGIEIAVVHYPSGRSFSIGCSLQVSGNIDLEKEVCPQLNSLDHNKGLPDGRDWGGHPDRIASPRPGGSFLTKEEILKIVQGCI